ncbi:hypothetical protein ACT3SP_03570 [Brachybacterium sp. AOP43-C2-M15]|uniref:hypothetical protein n=1 Tax=Brachybacterium sp. AOP43-C2-M15 TaxID=3457661 RepID=UPI0040342EFE
MSMDMHSGSSPTWRRSLLVGLVLLIGGVLLTLAERASAVAVPGGLGPVSAVGGLVVLLRVFASWQARPRGGPGE